MILPNDFFKVPKNKIISLFLTIFYVFISGYLVIFREYLEGDFFFKFFPSSLIDAFSTHFGQAFIKQWYANINKIIFPVYFWATTIGFAIVQNAFVKTSFNFHKAKLVFKYAFIFHLYLLLSTYVTEIVPDFAIMSGGLPPGELIPWYRQFFVGIFFSAYYFFWLQSFHKFEIKKNRWFQLVIIFSPLTLVFSPLDVTHFYCFVLALVVWTGFRLALRPSYSLSRSPLILNYAIYIVLVLGLFFRIKYATLFALSGESLIIFNADGEVYLNSAKSFFNESFEKVSYYQAPLYSYYLSWFLRWFGSEPSSIFYSQAVVGSALPWVTYKIAKELHYSRAAIIVAILTATDPLCIHYSVAINRSAALILTLTLLILLNVLIYKNSSSIKFFILGILMAATFYFGQETLPILLGMGAYSIYFIVRKKLKVKFYLKTFLSFALGFLFICMPINQIFHSVNGKWIWMGRYAQEGHSPSFFYKKSPPVETMESIGFNPIDRPGKSLVVWFENPLIVTQSILEKLWLELPGFLFDPDAVYFAPLHLNMESFYGAQIQFYIYFFLAIGAFYVLANARLPGYPKSLILGTILCQAIMTSIFIFGTNRFRAPVVPLNLILSGIGVWKILFERRYLVFLKANLINPTGKKEFISEINSKRLAWKIGISIILIGFSIIFFFKEPPLLPFKHTVSPWIFLSGDSIQMGSKIDINSHAISIVNTEDDPAGHNLEIIIPMCNYLIPGERPFYMLSIDGAPLGNPMRVPRGCTVLRSNLPLKKKRELLNFYFYYSSDPNLRLNNPKNLLMDNRGQKFPMTFFQSFTANLPEPLKQNARYYQEYAKGGMVLGKIRIAQKKLLRN